MKSTILYTCRLRRSDSRPIITQRHREAWRRHRQVILVRHQMLLHLVDQTAHRRPTISSTWSRWWAEITVTSWEVLPPSTTTQIPTSEYSIINMEQNNYLNKTIFINKLLHYSPSATSVRGATAIHQVSIQGFQHSKLLQHLLWGSWHHLVHHNHRQYLRRHHYPAKIPRNKNRIQFLVILCFHRCSICRRLRLYCIWWGRQMRRKMLRNWRLIWKVRQVLI